MFFLGLILIVLGTGLLKPNISAIVGDLYPDGGERRDAGFSIFYMGINLGATLGQIVTGLLGEKYGFHWGFGAAGIGMTIALVTYIYALASRTLPPDGRTHAAPTFTNALSKVRRGTVERRNESERDPGQRGDTEREREHGGIDAHLVEPRNGSRGERHERSRTEHRDSAAENPSHQ